MINVLLAAAASDTHLEQRVRTCGARVDTVPLDALARIAQPSSPAFDVLVLDVRGTRTIPPALKAVRQRHPDASVLLAVPALDTAFILEAMRAGVNECLADPIEVDDLRQALGRLTARRPSAPKSTVFGVIGARGGIGATTVAVNLGTVLATLQGAPTLLIDLHASDGDAALFLGAEPRYSVLDALDNAHRLDGTFLKGVVTDTKAGVHLLASPERPIVPGVAPDRLRQLMEIAASQYTHVVIDIPSTDPVVLQALDPLDAMVLITNQELSSVRSAGRLAEVLQRLYGKERVQVVVTRYDPSAAIGSEDVARIVGMPVQHVFPSHYALALASLNRGQPLVIQNHSKLAGALTRFARTLAGVPAQERHKPGGWRGLISGRR